MTPGGGERRGGAPRDGARATTPGGAGASERERFIVRLASLIRDDDVVNVATPLTASAAFLARATHAPGATMLWHGEIDPAPVAFPSLRDFARHDATGTASYGQADALRWIEAGRITLMFISPAQLDPSGDVNASRIGGRALPGGIGTADLVSLVGRLVAYKTGRSMRALVPRVEYVTASARQNAPGRRGVTDLVSPAGVFAIGDGRVRARSLAADFEPASWAVPVEVPDGVQREPDPSPEALRFLRELDPLGVADLELGRQRAAALARLTGAPC